MPWSAPRDRRTWNKWEIWHLWPWPSHLEGPEGSVTVAFVPRRCSLDDAACKEVEVVFSLKKLC